VTDIVVPGEDVVTCISCHRPHGSPYPDMLRWDYANDCNTGNPDTEANPCGCYSCHTTKDGA
jgi:predicted CXXCH cytochrome family protein